MTPQEAREQYHLGYRGWWLLTLSEGGYTAGTLSSFVHNAADVPSWDSGVGILQDNEIADCYPIDWLTSEPPKKAHLEIRIRLEFGEAVAYWCPDHCGWRCAYRQYFEEDEVTGWKPCEVQP